jgi:hypothetical protein
MTDQERRLAELGAEVDQSLAREDELVAALKQHLRKRPGAVEGSSPASVGVSDVDAGEIAELRRELESERRHRHELLAEIDRLQEQAPPAAAASQSPQNAAPQPEPPAAPPPQVVGEDVAPPPQPMPAVAPPSAPVTDHGASHAPPAFAGAETEDIEELRRELGREYRHRVALQEELELLRAGDGAESAPGPTSPTADLVRLRRELDEERAERRRLLAQLHALDQRTATHSQEVRDVIDQEADVQALRARLVELETRQQELMTSVARTLEADRQREEQLTAELTAARVEQQQRRADPPTATAASDRSELEAENTRLRSQLDTERRQNARLMAKLKVASRVADLVFKMRQQGMSVDALPADLPTQ